jgi:hypothetical protein
MHEANGVIQLAVDYQSARRKMERSGRGGEYHQDGQLLPARDSFNHLGRQVASHFQRVRNVIVEGNRMDVKKRVWSL